MLSSNITTITLTLFFNTLLQAEKRSEFYAKSLSVKVYSLFLHHKRSIHDPGVDAHDVFA